jgi:uncharacterized membrane-anchored protein YhcB (DUF1043 family)
MKGINLKDTILFGGIMFLIILLMMSRCEKTKMEKDLYEQVRATNKEIVKNSKLIKEKDGQYSKFVNNFNDQKDLLKQLKEENKDLYKTIKKSDEKLLMINNTLITLEGQVSEGFGKINPSDSNLIDLKLKYPNDKDWFISWDGTVHKKTAFYKGDWTFGKLPLQIILTETDKGIWNSRLIGPEWLKVDKMEVNAIKPEDITSPYVPQPRNFGLMLGGGYVKGFANPTTNALSIGIGGFFKNHSVIVNGTTNSTIGFNYYYRFVTFKKK